MLFGRADVRCVASREAFLSVLPTIPTISIPQPLEPASGHACVSGCMLGIAMAEEILGGAEYLRCRDPLKLPLAPQVGLELGENAQHI